MTDPKTGETRLNTVARLTRGMSFGVSGYWYPGGGTNTYMYLLSNQNNIQIF